MSRVNVTAAGETAAVDYDPGGATWEAMYAARDWVGLLDWYRATVGRRSSAPLLDIAGQLTVTQSWLALNEGGGHVSREADRWVITDIICSNVRLTNVDNVTLRDCVMQRRGRSMNYVVHAPASAPAHGILVENCTIDAEQFDCFGVYFPAAAGIGDIVVRRCDIAGVQSAVHATRGHTVEENLIHDLYYFQGSHNTAMSFRGGDGVARRNFVTPGGSGASGINFYGELPPYTNLWCTENIVDAPNALVSVNFPEDANKPYHVLEPGMVRECVGNVVRTRLSNTHLWSRCEGNSRFDGTPVG